MSEPSGEFSSGKSAAKAAAAVLSPLFATLGLEQGSFTPNQQAVQRAYKKALRQNPTAANELREAARVLSSSEEMIAFVRHAEQPVNSQTLEICVEPVRRGVVQHIGGESASEAGRPAYGFASLQGKRMQMEDELMLRAPLGGVAYAFGVFDGHGGARAARLLARHLPGALKRAWPADGEGAASSAFEEVEAKIRERSEAERWDDGSTALVACLDGTSLTLYQVGDCGACVWPRSSTDDAETPAHLCTQHRPTEPSEAARLAALGVTPSATGRVAGLAVSRAFGDISIKSLPAGHLTVTPEVVALTAPPGGGVLILACDGCWDHLSPGDACAILSREDPATTGDALQQAALRLADAALASGSDDNVSILLVDLPHGAQ